MRLLLGLLCVLWPFAQTSAAEKDPIAGAKVINATTVEVFWAHGSSRLFDFYAPHIFRVFEDPEGGMPGTPTANPPATILVDNPRRPVTQLDVDTSHQAFIAITTQEVIVRLDRETGRMQIFRRASGTPVLEEADTVHFEPDRVTMTLLEHPQEYFYGGGVQNGRFSHKGKVIAIENQNSWTDGGVASPNPFFWSTAGYGLMWHTFGPGRYDFGASQAGLVSLSHQTSYLDVFVMINPEAWPPDRQAAALLNDYYQLTGRPLLLPKFGFYQGHLNAYNRDYWAEDSTGILFEDGKRYKESQRDNGGIRESLNGELNNYQFSARAVIDRYAHHDMPFGWILPNDGYGAGYGQTETLKGNVNNLKSLGDYARQQGVEIGLWTQSDLHPKPEISALLQRDLVQEVRDAGARVLKTDVAWVGAGYSFGLHGITDAAHIMSYYGNQARPFIISLDGWAGTQRCAAIWTGDQTGGLWEYIRFHIPTYIGSGLSGNPNITSDMDGIFGGKNPVVNTRDYQWKTFTPMQMNMDGWGSNEKYPHALGEPYTSINRWYLKMKSELMPYTYSIARQAVDGLPMIRAMFLQEPNAYTFGKATQYQYLYGPYFLVAPIYKQTKAQTGTAAGDDVRDGIFLPDGLWVDYFSGEVYPGGCILNSFAAPVWKLPVLVKMGAIIPLTNPNNNVHQMDASLRTYELYPYGSETFTEYDDDGVSEAYQQGAYVTTLIESRVNAKGRVTVTIHPTQGTFDGFVEEKATAFIINVTQKPQKVTALLDGARVKLTEAASLADFRSRYNVFYYDSQPNLNRFATPGSAFEKEVITKNPQLKVRLAATDVTARTTVLEVDGYVFNPTNTRLNTSGPLETPAAHVPESQRQAYTLTPSWTPVAHADYYEIDFQGMRYTTIRDTALLFEGLEAATSYSFQVRAVNKDGASAWAEVQATTQRNPLEWALKGLTARSSTPAQGRSMTRLFDFEEGELWHTQYGTNALPLDVIIDLHTINQVDKIQYVPRDNAGNGTLLKGTVLVSLDNAKWTPAATFEWPRNNEVKVLALTTRPTARYIKVHIEEAVGGFGSGKELYVFKVPNTESYLPGDINHDNIIDNNDLTSYLNYMGLRQGDADFEGYIGKGDLNQNGLIDAYDVSVVATQLDGGVVRERRAPGQAHSPVAGSLQLQATKRNYAPNDTVAVVVRGVGLHAVNALSFALTYNPADYTFIGIQPLQVGAMTAFTNDRLHSNGVKSLYPAFIHVGNQEPLEGDADLFVIRFKARRALTFDLEATDGILVDKELEMSVF